MRTPRRWPVLLLLVSLFTAMPRLAPVGAQQTVPVLAPTTPGKVHRLTLSTGSQLLGKVLSVDADSIRFESELGVATISRASIISFREEAPGYVQEGQYFFPNPNHTRLIFAPTGRMLRKGEGYFSDFWIFFPSLATGITDWVTIGGGMSIIPGIGPEDQMFFLTPKVGIIAREQFNFAVGALALKFPETSAGVLYGVGTWGSMDHSFSTGVGYGYVDSEFADRPAILIGGETRVSPRLGLVTENYVLPGSTGLISAGVRFMGRDISVDLAFLLPMESGSEAYPIPLLGFMWKW